MLKVWRGDKEEELFLRAMVDGDGDFGVFIVGEDGEPIDEGLLFYIDVDTKKLVIVSGVDRAAAAKIGIPLDSAGHIITTKGDSLSRHYVR